MSLVESAPAYQSVWNAPSSERSGILRSAKNNHQNMLNDLGLTVERRYGRDSRESTAVDIVRRLDGLFTDIAAEQLDKFDPGGGKNWLDYAGTPAIQVLKIISSVRNDPQYSTFREQAPEFCQSLYELEALMIEKDGTTFRDHTRSLESHLKRGWAAGEPGLSIPLEDSYVEPNRPEGATPHIWVANAQLFFHLEPEAEDQMNEYTQLNWEWLLRLHRQPNRPAPEVMIGNAVAGMGTELFSATIGMSLDSGGFILALNNLNKREPFIHAIRHALPELPESRLALAWIFVAHEEGHNFDKLYAKRGSTDSILLAELRNDLAAVLISLQQKIVPAPELILAALVEALSGVLEDTPEEEAVFKGYTISGIVMFNILFETGTIRETSPGEFVFQLDGERLETALKTAFEAVCSENNYQQFIKQPLRPEAQRFVQRVSTQVENR